MFSKLKNKHEIQVLERAPIHGLPVVLHIPLFMLYLIVNVIISGTVSIYIENDGKFQISIIFRVGGIRPYIRAEKNEVQFAPL